MRFLIADDHSIVRLGLTLMLEAEYPDVAIDEAEEVKAVAKIVRCCQYDLLIIDFSIPQKETVSIIDNLLTIDQELKILIYTMSTDKHFAINALKAGVRGFLSKEAGHSELLGAIKMVILGKVYQ